MTMTPSLEQPTSYNIQYAQPLKIELSRGMRGDYGWTITVRGQTRTRCLKKIREIDAQLREEYHQNGGVGQG